MREGLRAVAACVWSWAAAWLPCRLKEAASGEEKETHRSFLLWWTESIPGREVTAALTEKVNSCCSCCLLFRVRRVKIHVQGAENSHSIGFFSDMSKAVSWVIWTTWLRMTIVKKYATVILMTTTTTTTWATCCRQSKHASDNFTFYVQEEHSWAFRSELISDQSVLLPHFLPAWLLKLKITTQKYMKTEKP